MRTEVPDAALIRACLRGDGHAWENLIERYERLIYSIPRRYGMSEADAAEVFQNVCITLLKQLDQLRDYEKLGAWLVTTTRRECWRQWRQAEPMAQPQRTAHDDWNEPAVTQEPSPEEVVAEYEEYRRVRAALERLAEGCRNLLWHLYYDPTRPSYADIARRLHLPVGSIGPTRARCLEKLRLELEEVVT